MHIKAEYQHFVHFRFISVALDEAPLTFCRVNKSVHGPLGAIKIIKEMRQIIEYFVQAIREKPPTK